MTKLLTAPELLKGGIANSIGGPRSLGVLLPQEGKK
jgi:hypothetical protein